MSQTKWVSNGVEFQVGDKVKVVRTVRDDASNGMGDGVVWNNVWIDTMTESIGTIAIVIGIDKHGAYLNGDEFEFGWPLLALENLSYKGTISAAKNNVYFSYPDNVLARLTVLAEHSQLLTNEITQLKKELAQ